MQSYKNKDGGGERLIQTGLVLDEMSVIFFLVRTRLQKVLNEGVILGKCAVRVGFGPNFKGKRQLRGHPQITKGCLVGFQDLLSSNNNSNFLQETFLPLGAQEGFITEA